MNARDRFAVAAWTILLSVVGAVIVGIATAILAAGNDPPIACHAPATAVTTPYPAPPPCPRGDAR